MLISAYLASIVIHLVFSGLFSLKLSPPLKYDDHIEQRYEIKDYSQGDRPRDCGEQTLRAKLLTPLPVQA
jgi:hypothetical protein